jgi:hypothetical protein
MDLVKHVANVMVQVPNLTIFVFSAHVLMIRNLKGQAFPE